jgi:hypothetical protein
VSLARVDGRPDEPGVEPVDLATLAQDFTLEVSTPHVLPAPPESVARLPKLDSLPEPE